MFILAFFISHWHFADAESSVEERSLATKWPRCYSWLMQHRKCANVGVCGKSGTMPLRPEPGNSVCP
uniref:Putative secreted protein n=1 Tax=Anopheles darlingi TaxID=43151 RepID=A0A2M4DHF1_ANODA